MYRYIFNPYSCRWEIQLLCWGIFWRTVRCVSFDELKEAQTYACLTGIAEHYRIQRPFNHIPGTQEQPE